MGLILPNQPPPSGLSIVIPAGVDVRPAVGTCYLCGAEFREGDNVMRHMKTCINDAGHDHRQEHEERKERLAIFSEEAWDPEAAAHLRKVGERMLKEGRWVVRPNERAGFS